MHQNTRNNNTPSAHSPSIQPSIPDSHSSLFHLNQSAPQKADPKTTSYWSQIRNSKYRNWSIRTGDLLEEDGLNQNPRQRKGAWERDRWGGRIMGFVIRADWTGYGKIELSRENLEEREWHKLINGMRENSSLSHTLIQTFYRNSRLISTLLSLSLRVMLYSTQLINDKNVKFMDFPLYYDFFNIIPSYVSDLVTIFLQYRFLYVWFS